MLQQITEEQNVPAAQVRVTPQEFVEALTAVETRNHAQPDGQDGTLALGDMVEQLSLEFTPEQLLAEVKAKRTSSISVTNVRRRSRWTAVKVFLALSLVCNVWVGVRLLRVGTRDATTSGITNNARTTGAIVDGNVARFTLQEALLNSVPLSVSLDDLRQIAKSPQEALTWKKEFTTPQVQDTGWTLIHLEDGWYVRGWRAEGDSFTVQNVEVHGQTHNFFARQIDNLGKQLTLPISVFKAIRDPEWVWTGGYVGDTFYSNQHVEGVDIPAE